jgi:ABC-2 type transport system permease protein
MIGATGARRHVPFLAQLRTFIALCERDLWVTVRRQPIPFLAQSLLQPIFFLFIFGRILPSIGAANANFANLLFPGIMALTIFLTSLQSVAFPLIIEFSFTKEIEDRLLSPLATWAVAIQKVAFATVRALFAGLVLIPLAYVILPGFSLPDVNWLLVALVMVLGAVAAGCIGLAMGTLVPPNQINLVFAVVLTPLMMTGATYYPWASLGSLQWFQLITLLNPMTYASEGLRAAFTPQVPHMDLVFVLIGLVVATAGFGAIGVRGFLRRAID